MNVMMPLMMLMMIREVFVVIACVAVCLAAGMYAAEKCKRDPLERYWKYPKRRKSDDTAFRSRKTP